MKDVAKHADVALSSVSRVLNDHPDVSSEMRARVLLAVAELGYEPDLLASSLRRGRTKTIGFLVTDIANPLFADIAKGAEIALDAAGYSLILTNSEGDALRDERGVRLFRHRRVDGLILSISDEESPHIGRALSDLQFPIVLLDREMSALPDISAVLVDHASGMRAATEHLLDLGHQRVALLVGPMSIRPDRERVRGFMDACRRRKVPLAKDLLHMGSNLSAEFGERKTEWLLRGPATQRPTAIIAGGNLVLIGLLRTLQRHHIKIGPDISVISCDDVPLAELYSPPITVIARDTIRMGTTAAEMMLSLLAEDDNARQRHLKVLQTRLTIRGSTVPPPIRR